MKSIISFCACMILTFPVLVKAQTADTPATLHQLANEYYNWRNQNYPVLSSDAGLHTWDSGLTAY